MEALEQLRDQAGAAFEELFGEIQAKVAAAQDQAGILDSLRGFAAAVNWEVQQHLLVSESLSSVYMVVCLIQGCNFPKPEHSTSLARGMQEPWIIGLLALQALLFLAVLLFRKRPQFKLAVFFLAGTHLPRALLCFCHCIQHPLYSAPHTGMPCLRISRGRLLQLRLPALDPLHQCWC